MGTNKKNLLRQRSLSALRNIFWMDHPEPEPAREWDFPRFSYVTGRRNVRNAPDRPESDPSCTYSLVKVFNLNALVSSLGDETSFNSSKLIISRAEGDFYIGQNRALLSKPIKLETAEAKMSWTGEILKNNNGLMDQLDLSLEMRLKVSENIPWYAAVFGGIPALAGGFVLENIIDERVDDASTFKFNITGSIDDPKIIRLN